MKQAGWRAIAPWVCLLALAGCGGGSDSTAIAGAETHANADAPVPPADPRITLSAYAANRTVGVPAVVAPDVALQAGLALSLPALEQMLYTSNGLVPLADAAIVLPPLQAARIDVLRAAAEGDTLAELMAALPAPAAGDATRALLGGVSRKLWAPASALFKRSFLASTDIGGTAGESWSAAETGDGFSFGLAVSAYGSLEDLRLSTETRLVIGQRFDAEASVNGQATAFVGVGQSSPNTWYTAPMVALHGPGGTLRADGYVATATWAGDHLWVSLRPPGDDPLFLGLRQETLRTALLAVWSAYPTPQGVTSQSAQVWPQTQLELENRSRLPAGISLPYNEVHANLRGLDGGGTYLNETMQAALLAIGQAGLRVSGAQAMAFKFSVRNLYGPSGGFIAELVPRFPPPPPPPPCPRATADWRGAYLALVNRTGQLLLLASLPHAGAAAAVCTPI